MPVTKIRSKWENGDLVFEHSDGTEIARFDESTDMLDVATLGVDGTEITATAAELNDLDNSATVADGLGRVRVARATYDISGGDAGTTGSHGLGVTIPDNAIIIDGVIDVITTFNDGADDSATIAIQVEAANDIVSAVAISDGTNPWDAGLQDIVPDGTAANMVKTTGDQEITAVVADDEIDAGKLVLFLRYVVSE